MPRGRWFGLPVIGAVLLLIATGSALANPPVIEDLADFAVEATGPGGAEVIYGLPAATTGNEGNPAPTVACDPDSKSIFPLGPTLVTCTATDPVTSETASDTFTVTVRDTTPPVLAGVPDEISGVEATGVLTSVSYSAPTASDLVDASVPVECDHPSASGFAVGTTTVTCSATDVHGNTGTGTFSVTVVDTTPPAFAGVPADITKEATGLLTPVSYTPPTATDGVDGSVAVGCNHASGSTFPIQLTTVSCSATDAHGNTGTASFTVTVADTQAPTLGNMPADITNFEATGPQTHVSYAEPTASDTVDGVIQPDCQPPSGGAFPLGPTTVSCSASDEHGNTTPTKTFHVTVVDTTPPTLNLPSPAPFEATSGAGAAVGFSVTATDLVDPSPTVSCDHSPGAVFPLGATAVSCTAKDALNNTSASKSFAITVVDSTPPSLILPAPAPVEATSAAGAAVTFTVGASDLVDPSPTATCDHASGAVFPRGNTTVGCTGKDARGNTSHGAFVVTVKDTIAPANVTGLSARTGDGSVTLSWTKPQSDDFDRAGVFRSRPGTGGLGTQIYTGRASKVRLRRLRNGVTYRFVVVSLDRSGNRSRGVAILARPALMKLFSPANGATVTRPPVLHWARVKRATYYNVQLFREPTTSQARGSASGSAKIFSAWPRGTRLTLKKHWRYGGRTYRLTPGVYRWFVWPGYGRPSAGRYGRLLGQSMFVVKP